MQNLAVGVGLLLSSLVPLAGSGQTLHLDRFKAVCTTPAAGSVACGSKVMTAPDGKIHANATGSLPPGLSPAQFKSAYGVPASTGGRLAVIGAYDNPNVKSDL